MQTTFDALVEQFGKYTQNGTDYTLTQDAYPEVNAGSSVIGSRILPGDGYYTADGYDRDGNSVRLVWEITSPDAEDAQDACEWNDFDVVPTPWGDPAPWAAVND